MKEKLEAFELERQQICKKANIFLIIGIVLSVVPFLLIMYTAELAFLLMFVAGLILIGINSSMKSKLTRRFKNEIIVSYVKSVYPNCIYDPSVGIHKDIILQAGFFKSPDKWYLEDYLKASYDGVEFEMSDFNFQERHVTRDSKGNTRVTYITYAKGRFMIFDFKRDFNKTVMVVENSHLGLRTGGLEKVETESIDFNDKFKVYSSDAVTAYYVLTPQVQLKMLELESKFKGSIFFSYKQGKLYVAITDGVSILDINASKKISQETIDILESQLLVPASIINELGLSSEKYSTGDAI